jgi:hypothetical protein
VTVRIPGLPAAGEAQCATWAGDGSHRMPMMVFANQVPAFDAVRITVRGAGAAAAEPAEVSEQAPASEQAPEAEAETPATGTEEPATGADQATGTEETTEATGTAAPQPTDVEDATADVTGTGTRSRDDAATGSDG